MPEGMVLQDDLRRDQLKGMTINLLSQVPKAADLNGMVEFVKENMDVMSTHGLHQGKLSSAASSLFVQVLRDMLDQMIKECIDKSQPVGDNVRIKDLVFLAFACIKSDIISTYNGLSLMGDYMELQTADELNQSFGFLEEMQSILSEFVCSSGSQGSERYIVIKACNSLLKRMCHAKHLSLAGRVLVFLASVMPLSEKSALNRPGLFNTAELPVFDSEQMFKESSSQLSDDGPALENDEKSTKAKQTSNLSVEYSLYKRIWEIQEYYRNPEGLLGPSNQHKFKGFVDDLWSIFKALGKIPFIQSNDQLYTQTVRTRQFFAPKYLTSSQLIKLQLNDVLFRRQYCAQTLIFLQYLKANWYRTGKENQLTGTEKQPTGKDKQKEKKKIEEKLLENKQLDDLSKIKSFIWQSLESVPPNGKEFARKLELVLKDEVSWMAWKAESNCAEFEKDPISTDIQIKIQNESKPNKLPKLRGNRTQLLNEEKLSLLTKKGLEQQMERLDEPAPIKSMQWYLDEHRSEVDFEMEQSDMTTLTSHFSWSFGRALRRSKYLRFHTYKEETGWVQGTLYEQDNKGAKAPVLIKKEEPKSPAETQQPEEGKKMGKAESDEPNANNSAAISNGQDSSAKKSEGAAVSNTSKLQPDAATEKSGQMDENNSSEQSSSTKVEDSGTSKADSHVTENGKQKKANIQQGSDTQQHLNKKRSSGKPPRPEDTQTQPKQAVLPKNAQNKGRQASPGQGRQESPDKARQGSPSRRVDKQRRNSPARSGGRQSPILAKDERGGHGRDLRDGIISSGNKRGRQDSEPGESRQRGNNDGSGQRQGRAHDRKRSRRD